MSKHLFIGALIATYLLIGCVASGRFISVDMGSIDKKNHSPDAIAVFIVLFHPVYWSYAAFKDYEND